MYPYFLVENFRVLIQMKTIRLFNEYFFVFKDFAFHWLKFNIFLFKEKYSFKKSFFELSMNNAFVWFFIFFNSLKM